MLKQDPESMLAFVPPWPSTHTDLQRFALLGSGPIRFHTPIKLVIDVVNRIFPIK